MMPQIQQAQLEQQQNTEPAPPPASIVLSNGEEQITLSIGPHGDLWVTQQSGPNAGKQADLTFGRWQ
jgi:hypothetical protein